MACILYVLAIIWQKMHTQFNLMVVVGYGLC